MRRCRTDRPGIGALSLLGATTIEVARLTAIYEADTRNFDQGSARVESRLHAVIRLTNLANFNPYIRGSQQAATSSHVLAGAVGGLAALLGVSLTGTIRNGAGALLDYSSKLETTRIAFSTMMGSVQAADRHLRELQQFAIQTPFHFSELIDASARMRALGFATEEVIPLLRDVGNVTAASGDISAERLQRIIKALSDVRSRGALYSQEIRQFAEAAIPVYDILEKQLGKSRAELVKMVEAGEISSATFFDAFQKFSRANFGDLMEKQSRTFRGAMSNITDILLQTGATAFDPFYRELSQLTVRTASEIQSQDFEGAIQTIIENAFEGAGKGAANIAVDLVDEFFDSAERQAEKRSRSFNPLMFGASAADSFIGQLRNRIAGVTPGSMTIAELGQETTRAVSQSAGADLARLNSELERALRRGGGGASETTAADTKLLEKQKDLVQDLTLRLRFFGDNSQTAATKQKLLAAGVTDLNTGLAAQAIRLAQVLDKMQFLSEVATADANRKFQDQQTLAEELAGALKAASDKYIEISDELAGGSTELEKFSLSLLKSRGVTEGHGEAVKVLEKALARLDEVMARKKGVDERKRSLEEIEGAAKSLADTLLEAANPPSTKFEEFLRDLYKIEKLSSVTTTQVKNMRDVFETFPEGENRARSFTAIFEKLLADANDGKGTIKLTADEIRRLAMQFGFAADAALKFDSDLKKTRADESFTRAAEDLLGVIDRDIVLTNRQRLEKLLLTEAYKDLTAAQRGVLQSLADEADRSEAARKAGEERLRELEAWADDIVNVHHGIFDRIGEGWRGLWSGMLDTARNIINQIVDELLRSLITGQRSQSGGLIGFGVNLLGSLFGGLGFGGAGGLLPNSGQGIGAMIPGRAFGGPVEAGMLYETHGLGKREWFVPNRNGQVVTGSPARGGRETSVTLNVTFASPASTPYARQQQAQVARQLADMISHELERGG